MNSYAAPVRGCGRAKPATTLFRKCFENNVQGGRFIQFATNTAFNISSPSKFTVRCWCRLGYSFNNNGLVSRTGFASNQGDWALGVMTGSTTRMAWRLNNNAVIITSLTDLSPMRWYFIEASYDSSLASNNMKLFIDGVLNIQGNYTTVITNNNTPIIIGGYFGSSNEWIGQIAEVEFCANFIRNTTNYTPPKIIIPDANTTFLLRMSGPSMLTDYSGRGFVATFGGTPATEPTDPAYRKVTGLYGNLVNLP